MEINRSILRQKKELLILIILSLSGILAIVWWMIFGRYQPSDSGPSSLGPNHFQDLTLGSTRLQLSSPCQQILTILDCMTSKQQDSTTVLRYEQYLSERSLLSPQELEQQCETTYRDIVSLSGSLPIDSLSCLQ